MRSLFKKLSFWSCFFLLSLFSLSVHAQDGRESVDIFLDDEKLDVEADIPSVDLIIDFKGSSYKIKDYRESFVPELVKTAKQDPF